MNQIVTSWGALNLRNRVIAIGASAVIFAAILALSVMSTRPGMSLLYSGLDPAQSGEVVAALEQKGVAYNVRADAIYVDAARRDEVRMILAAEGLPKQNGAGYELLDSLSGFGTTAQMFDAAYWRAKEGELARTILVNTNIRTARVHIAPVTPGALRRDGKAAASVMLSTSQGGLSDPQARALQFLVASAVAGLKPEDVTILDSSKGVIASGDMTPSRMANDRETELRRNIERLLEARVGYGNAVVEVSVQTVSEHEAITERRFDPQSRVIISTENTETTKQADASKPSAVTVASNLPDGEGANGGSSKSQASETRERTNYEVSETKREIVRSPGDTKRITVAVLVDGVAGPDTTAQGGKQPRSEEELTALRDLVASAVGFDEARGDVITIKSMPFDTALQQQGSEATGGLFSGMVFDPMRVFSIIVLALVALILGLFVLRPALLGRKRMDAMAPGTLGLPMPDNGPENSDLQGWQPSVAMIDTRDMKIETEPPRDDHRNADPVERLKALITTRQAESIEILRGWVESHEGRT